MKNIKTVIITLLCIAMAEGVIYGIHLYIQHQQQVNREREVGYMYHHQNYAIPTYGPNDNYKYYDYSVVDERKLYYYLITYNSELDRDLTLDDVKEYLSSPYNVDGTLRVEYGWEKIHKYIEGFPYVKDKVGRYQSKLEHILKGYTKTNEIENQYLHLDALSYEQIGELINKNSDPEYEIDDEIMISELYDDDFEVSYRDLAINKDTTAEELFDILWIDESLREKNCIATTEKYDYWEYTASVGVTEGSMRFVFKTDKADGRTYFAAVWLDKIPTKKGVETGDNVEKMWKTYGMPYNSNPFYYGSNVFQRRTANTIMPALEVANTYDAPDLDYDANNDYREYYYIKETPVVLSFIADKVTGTIRYICIEFL